MSKRMPLIERDLPAVARQRHTNETDSMESHYINRKNMTFEGDLYARRG
jgi:hypothetical protein